MADTAHPKPPVAEPDLAGRQLGDYCLLRRLGRGGMAEVYLAEQLSLKRQVAFKVLKSSLAGDPSYVRRFVNEAQAAAALVHANIVQIYEVGCKEGVHFIAQEYVAGQNLRQYLTRRKSLTPRETAAVMLQVSAALSMAAEKGIVHRDIKPENIMLTTKGEVKVADFGLARMASEAVNLTQVGVTMGTPLYMSPEQVEGKAVDHRSDLYSLGVTAYQMLAGRPPFEGENALAVAVQHLKTEPPRLQTLRADVPPGMCRIVHRLLAKDPAKRYPHPADLMRDLRATADLGAGEGFSGPIDVAGGLDNITAANPRWEATQRLDTIMHSEKASAASRPRGWHVALALVAALFLGAVVARATRREPLLAVNPADLPPVNRMDSASAQYYYATHLNTVKAYESVWEYFPQDEYYRLRAKQRLAEHYLSEEKFDAALKIYDELTNVDPANEQFRLLGYAGRALVYDRQRDYPRVIENLAQVKGKEAKLGTVAPHWGDELRRIEQKVASERLK